MAGHQPAEVRSAAAHPAPRPVVSQRTHSRGAAATHRRRRQPAQLSPQRFHCAAVDWYSTGPGDFGGAPARRLADRSPHLHILRRLRLALRSRPGAGRAPQTRRAGGQRVSQRLSGRAPLRGQGHPDQWRRWIRDEPLPGGHAGRCPGRCAGEDGVACTERLRPESLLPGHGRGDGPGDLAISAGRHNRRHYLSHTSLP